MLAALMGHIVWFGFVNRRLLVVGALVALLVGPLSYPFLPTVIRDRVEGTFRVGQSLYGVEGAAGLEGSAALRVALWRIGWDMFSDSPIWGQGLGSFELKAPRYGAGYGVLSHRSPHNLPIKVAAESGLIGLAVFGWLVLAVLSVSLALWRSQSTTRYLGALVLAVSMTFGVANLFATVAYENLVSIYIWALVGLIGRLSVTPLEEISVEAEGDATSAHGRRVPS